MQNDVICQVAYADAAARLGSNDFFGEQQAPPIGQGAMAGAIRGAVSGAVKHTKSAADNFLMVDWKNMRDAVTHMRKQNKIMLGVAVAVVVASIVVCIVLGAGIWKKC
jgi:hypothetical protein